MRRIREYLREGVWERDLREAPWYVRIGLVALRAAITVVANLERHRVGTSAGALTVTTMLAIVPLAAAIFSVARGFGFGTELDQQLAEFSKQLPPHFQEIVDTVRDLVAAIDFAKLGILSSLLVLYTGMSLFVRVERLINVAWEASVQRSWLRRLTDFVTLVVIVPLFAIAAITLNSALTSASAVGTLRTEMPWLARAWDSGLSFAPHILFSIALTALYKFMPNTRVRWWPAVIGGVVGGFALMFMHELYLELQIGVARSNRIYATLAALPLLIVYLQLAWTIVLAGAQIGHAVQHANLLHGGKYLREPNPAVRERLALALTERAVRGFSSGEGGVTLATAAVELDVPRSLLDSTCDLLSRAAILAKVGRERVMPAKPGDQISAADVRAAIGGGVPAAVRDRVTLSETLEAAVRGAESADRSAREAIRFSA